MDASWPLRAQINGHVTDTQGAVLIVSPEAEQAANEFTNPKLIRILGHGDHAPLVPAAAELLKNLDDGTLRKLALSGVHEAESFFLIWRLGSLVNEMKALAATLSAA